MSISLLSPLLADYLKAHNRREHPVLKRCREETAELPQARMQISPEQGAFQSFLLHLIDARRCFEIGVFTGYSALVTALSVGPRGGTLLGCDLSEEWTRRARGYFAEAGLSSTLELAIGPAVDTLTNRLEKGEAGSYDFGFIDADKENYGAYYELSLSLLRPGGILVCDNMLWGGKVAAPEDQSVETVALRKLARETRSDSRVDATLVAIGDGLLLCRKL